MKDQITIIKQFIEEQQISETQLAHLAGIPQPTLTRNLNGTHRLSLKNYEKIKQAMEQIQLKKDTKSYVFNANDDIMSMAAAENESKGHIMNVDILDIIKSQQETISKLVEQAEKLTDIIHRMVTK